MSDWSSDVCSSDLPASDVREPGDWMKFDIGPESFIVVRGDNGGLHAHYNVCPHRGSQLVRDDMGSQNSFTCPFHSWQFDLDGKNTRATHAETFLTDVLCPDQHHNRTTSGREKVWTAD